MGLFLYNIFLLLFRPVVGVASLFNSKARRWLKGRRNLIEKLEKDLQPGENTIWMHCASLGEFEQGRPVIEKLRKEFPDYKILLTFFSPSGYEVQKGYKGADWVSYLPLDGKRMAKRFLDIVNPSMVVFIKYEYWYYYLKEINERKIPLLLVSAFFKPDMIFFRWYGGLYRKMLSFFDHMFIQNNDSKNLLNKIGLADKSTVAGDTRFDRVLEIAQQPGVLPLIEQFVSNKKIIVAGSTWFNEETIIHKALLDITDTSIAIIIAPHEIHEKHINELKKLFSGAMLYSHLKSDNSQTFSRVLIIDNIGMLSRLYKYAHITYVGGGFNKSGIHNILEAAVYSKPVIWGPHFVRFREAVELIEKGGGISVNNSEELRDELLRLLTDEGIYAEYCLKAAQYVRENSGATGKITAWIQEKRLLTN